MKAREYKTLILNPEGWSDGETQEHPNPAGYRIPLPAWLQNRLQ